MRLCTVDLESYWSATHTLTKMSPIEYVMHEDTELISVAYKFDNGDTECVFGEANIKAWAKSVDWSDVLVVGHNLSGFDSMILAWRLGVRPRMWGCTAAMARNRFAKTTALVPNQRTGAMDTKDGVSLAKLVREFNVGEKDQTILHDTRGKRLADFTEHELALMATYNKADVDQCHALFHKLVKFVPLREMLAIDMTVRMLTDPVLEVNVSLLEDTLSLERQRKHDALVSLAMRLGVYEETMTDDEAAKAVAKILGSAPKFVALLNDYGVEAPRKISKTTGEETYALAKTDEEFKALCDHDEPIVAAAARARLDVKSTQLETRIEAFIKATNYCKGKLPVPLKYAGADTTGRWSGEQYNMQNLPRIPRDKDGNIIHKPTNALRACLTAGAGNKVVVADLSGIELRVNHFLWKVPSSMALYQADPEKADLYKDFAAALYGIDKSEVSKAQRQVGKVAHLGLGFGAGAATFQKVAKLMGGVDIPLEAVLPPSYLHGEDGYYIEPAYSEWRAQQPTSAVEIVQKWRQMYKEIAVGWRTCHNQLGAIQLGEDAGDNYFDPWKMITTVKGGILLPSGREIRYPLLKKEETKDGQVEWMYGHGRNRARIYAGKIDENIVQALARDIITDNALAVFKSTGYRPCLMVHDELVYVAPESEAEDLLDEVQRVMRTPPVWWPGLVTWSEGDIADTYGEAK